MTPLSADSLVTAARWLRGTNGAGETIPAFAVVRVTGSGTDDVYTAAKPDEDGQYAFVWGIHDTPAGFVGTLTNDYPAYALYESGDGAPAVGETWGAGAGSFKLRKDKPGFRVVGSPDATLGVVPVARPVQSILSDRSILIGDYDITADATWQSTGLTIDIPEAGTYLFFGAAGATITATTANGGNGDRIDCRLYNVTDAATEMFVLAATSLPFITGLASAVCVSYNWKYFHHLLIFGGAKTLRLDGFRTITGSPTYSISQVLSGSFLAYAKVG